MLTEEKKFNLIYSKQSLIALVLFAVPMVIVLSVVFITIAIATMPDWLILTLVLSSVVVSLVLTLYLVFAKLSVAVEVTLDKDGICYILEKPNMFYKRKLVKTSWANVKNVSFNAVSSGSRSFAQITFLDPSETITLSPLKGESADEKSWEFWLDLNKRVGDFNAGSATKIEDKGFYEGNGAIVLTVLTVIVVTGITIIKIVDTESVPWYRVLAVYAFAGLWFANYKAARDRRKNKTQNNV